MEKMNIMVGRKVLVLPFRDHAKKRDISQFEGWFHGFYSEGNTEDGIDVCAIVEDPEGNIHKVWNLDNVKFIHNNGGSAIEKSRVKINQN